MSHRSSSANGVRLAKCDSQQWRAASPEAAGGVKLAGEEAKDRLYEPKHKRKAVRALTVVAYVFCVSLAAIALSLYYVFLWKGGGGAAAAVRPAGAQRAQRARCENGAVAERQKQLPSTDDDLSDLTSNSNTTPPTFIISPLTSSTVETEDALEEDISLTYEDSMPNQELQSLDFIKKLMKLRGTFNEND